MGAFFTNIFSNIKGIFTWWVIIAPWEQALRIRLGKHVRLLQAGVCLKIPGMDVIYKQPTRVRTVDIGLQTVTTIDKQVITVAGNVQFQIDDLEVLYRTIHNPSSVIIDFAASHIAHFIATHTTEDCTPQAICQYATQQLELSKYGLKEGQVNLTDFALVRTFRLIQESRVWRDDQIDMDPEGVQL